MQTEITFDRSSQIVGIQRSFYDTNTSSIVQQRPNVNKIVQSNILVGKFTGQISSVNADKRQDCDTVLCDTG